MIQKIISGGQTGADRAALDFVIACNIPHGGWIPKGRKTEDGTLPEKYHLQEMATGQYSKRTEKNILDSDGTFIVSHGPLTGGSALTKELAKQHRKPCIHIDLETTPYPETARMIREWVRQNGIKVMNVAGARGSKDPKIYQAVTELLEATMSEPIISSLESLCEMKLTALRIEPDLECSDEKRAEKAKVTYEDLVDRFYQENEEIMAPQQYEAAKKDFEYFMRLLDLAYHYFEDMEGKGT